MGHGGSGKEGLDGPIQVHPIRFGMGVTQLVLVQVHPRHDNISRSRARGHQKFGSATVVNLIADEVISGRDASHFGGFQADDVPSPLTISGASDGRRS